ncbi:efflux RND transporter periplasmic adaptor subunit [Arhodomonas sp. SL1]|uniref:efflux RND transporter periplasmic adaptor subunit n=1 Tax=Arhodomonas sp. SL1 TaxID=3425691 RepID=UPI003F884C6F
MKVTIRLLLVALFLGAIFGGIFGWKHLQEQRMAEQADQPQPPATVTATEAEQTSWRPAIRAVGSVNATEGIDITTEVAGKISEIAFESGARVAAGETLLRLDDSVDQAALAGLRADRELARVQFERTSDLLPRRAVSQSEFDEAKARYDASRAAVSEQQARIAKKTIKAPFDGLLGLAQVDNGEYLTPGQPIVTLTALDPVYVDYSVPERRFSELEVGQAVQVSVAAYPDRTFEGEISAIDSGIQEGTRSVQVRATLPNPEDALRPGMFARVATLLPETGAIVTVPRTAISYNTYGDFVFLITEDERGRQVVQRRAVSTGSSREGRVEVAEGLEAGEQVVRAGLVKLRDGQPVTIDNSVELDTEITGE